MGKMAVFLLGAAVSAGFAQSSAPLVDPADPRPPVTVTTGPNTTGTPDMGATTPQGQAGQADRRAPVGDSQPAATSPATVPHTTATSDTGATTPTDRKQTSGHIPRTPVAPGSTVTTHSGSTPIAADQRDVRTTDSVNGTANRTMPDTASGWLPAMLSGMLLAGLGVSVRLSTELSSRAGRR
jgi:hypothetical protein